MATTTTTVYFTADLNDDRVFVTALATVENWKGADEPHTIIYEHTLNEETGEQRDRLVAICATTEDADRIKALLVYYGDRFPPRSLTHTPADRVEHVTPPASDS